MGAHRTDARHGRAPLPWCPPSSTAAHPLLPWLPGGAPLSQPPPPSPVRTLLARLGTPRLVALLAAVSIVLVATAVAVVHRGAPTVTTPFLSYTPPAGWTVEPADADAPPDAPALVGRARGPGYDCGGQPSVRGYVGAALLPADASAGSGPADRAERLARWFAATSYETPGAAPALTVAPARPVRVPGPDGPVDATVTEVTAAATGAVTGAGGCAPSGTVLALAAPVSGGAALLIVAGDTGGGPAQPPPPDRATLDAVLASVRLGPQ